MKPVRAYLDHVATTPLLPAAREAMIELLDEGYGNPSSPHGEGRAAKDALEAARSRVARALACRPREVVFTSGATEALQIALYGAVRARPDNPRRIVVGATEHPAILEVAEDLETRGYELVRVPVDDAGRVSPEEFVARVDEEPTAAAALMLANHEVGTCMPVADVAPALSERGIPLLCDAALGPGRLAVRPAALGVPLMAFSGHKFNGPRGTGFLYVRRGTKLARWMRGGLQEERLRAGTENVAGIAGLSVAFERATADATERAQRYRAVINAFLEGLDDLDGWRRLGSSTDTLPGVVTLELAGVEGEAAMINMDLEGFAVATGSACALGSADPSPGLLAMGLTRKRAASTLRISVGEGVDVDTAKRASSSLRGIVSRLRSLARH